MTPSTMTTSDDSLAAGEQPPDTAYYVYGVVLDDSARVPDGMLGVDGAPVELISHGDLAAVVGLIALDRPPGRRADLLAHSEVLDTLASTGPVAPVQFGSVMADREGVVADLLAPHEAYFGELLEQLKGRSQFTLRATYHEESVLAEVVAADPEIAALRERTRDLPEDAAYGERVRLGELVARAMEGKRDYDAVVLLDAVLPYVAAHAVRGGGGLDHLLDVALLVDDDRRQEFEEQLEALAEAVHERIRLRLVGPGAPYDFVGDA